jgi:hypothetical protein
LEETRLAPLRAGAERLRPAAKVIYSLDELRRGVR